MQISWRNMGMRQERGLEDCLSMADRICEERQDYAGDSTMLVSVLSYEEGIPRGAFLSFEYNQRYEFQGLDQMLLAMEDIMDSVSVPRPAFDHRSFYGKPYRFQETEPEKRMPAGRMRPEDIPGLPRGKGFFELRFYYRQYGSLQGEFIAVPENKKGAKNRSQEKKSVAFRSALELMRLIHEYLEEKIGAVPLAAE